MEVGAHDVMVIGIKIGDGVQILGKTVCILYSTNPPSSYGQ